MIRYYDERGWLRREVFVDWPKQLAQQLNASRTNLRRLYDHVAAIRFRIRMKDEGHQAPQIIREGMGQLYRFAQYQAERKVVNHDVRNFIQTHCDAIGDDAARFEGFYQLFQSTMAYLRR